MSKIRLLPQNLINLIAAGEVVERPSSVLKELIENSIDAESTKIIVNIKDFGNELIEVKDNGVGMDQENAKLAFKQHATSKISSEDDLHKILSFGFRGEALASISSVAERVELQSKTSTDEPVSLTISSGKEAFASSTQTEKGTTISIYNLFKNIPARKKFLKSNAVELKHLTEMFINTALPHLAIHFELYHNEKLIYRLTKTTELKDRVFEIWGKTMAAGLFEPKVFEMQTSEEGSTGVKITGYFGKPEIGKKSYNFQYTYVNNRFVINKITSAAVQEAYRGFIHKDLKPAYFLFIEIDPEKIDINIHPRKTEIRFLNSQEIFRYTYSLCKKTLESSTRSLIIDNLQTETNNFAPKTPASDAAVDFQDVAVDIPVKKFESYKATQPSFLSNDGKQSYTFKSNPSFKIQEALSFTKGLLEKAPTESETADIPTEPQATSAEQENAAESMQQFKADNVFQLFNTYIVFEKANKLIMLDQHASAEKILFEKLYSNLGELKTKPLLIPEIIELRQQDKSLILERKEELKNIGIIIEDFGQDSIQILEIPEPIDSINIQEYINEIVDSNPDLERTYDQEKTTYSKLNKQVYMMLATAACHGSIRAGQKLEKSEMLSIIQNLLTIKNPYNCPHGRPTMWQLERSEIEKNFKRKL